MPTAKPVRYKRKDDITATITSNVRFWLLSMRNLTTRVPELENDFFLYRNASFSAKYVERLFTEEEKVAWFFKVMDMASAGRNFFAGVIDSVTNISKTVPPSAIIRKGFNKVEDYHAGSTIILNGIIKFKITRPSADDSVICKLAYYAQKKLHDPDTILVAFNNMKDVVIQECSDVDLLKKCYAVIDGISSLHDIHR